MMYAIPATARHVRAVAFSLRDQDAAECSYFGLDPIIALQLSIRATDSYTVMLDGVPVGLFGCGPNGEAWLMGTPLLTVRKREFIDMARHFISRFLHRHGSLHNFIWKGNTVHNRFLEWLGATFADHGGFRSFQLV